MVAAGTADSISKRSLVHGSATWRHLPLVATILLGLSLLTAIVPFSPRMPGVGLDASWITVVNQAAASNMAFGRDLVNTFGPYAALFTKAYHPDIDDSILAASVLLAAAYLFLALIAFKGHRGAGYLLIAVFFGLANIDLNSIFFAFPVFFAIAVYRSGRPSQADEGAQRERPLLAGAILAGGIGNAMLCLSKVSMIPYSWVMMSICAAWLTVHKKPGAALGIFISYAAFVVALWLVSGQPLSALPLYFSSTVEIISGYGDAMSYPGRASEIYSYLFIAAATLLLLWIEHRDSLRNRLFLGVVVATSYFFSFKAAFVRHDGLLFDKAAVLFSGHAATGALALLLVGVCATALFRSNARIVIGVLLGLLGSALIISNYGPANPLVAGRHVVATQLSAINGIWSRLGNKQTLENRYRERIGLIRGQLGMPQIEGSFDLYSYDQAYLLAHEVEWNPRPAFQSYFTYTPDLLRANLAHLQGPDAAPNIIFKVQPIDGRYPSLDDGLSWQVLMRQYQPSMRLQGGRGGFLLLQRRKETQQSSTDPRLKFTAERIVRLGERVPVRASDLQYAQMRFKKTLAGKLVSAAYKAPMLFIQVELRGGRTLTYRVVSGMTETGFLLSPLIDDSEKFILASLGQWDVLRDSEVVAFTLMTEKGGGWAWSNEVAVAVSDAG
jgi:hypothetical protein